VKASCLVRVASLLSLASMGLTAQVPRQANEVPLKNWSTPLYWQPNQSEREASTVSSQRAVPQLQFSANAVSADALTFVAITPCRLVDTRGSAAGFIGVTPFSGPSLAAAETLPIPVQSFSQTSTTAPAPCGTIPSVAQAYSFNITVVPAGVTASSPGGPVDFVSIWPYGFVRPNVATLNDPQGSIVANAAIIAAGEFAGAINVYNAGPSATDLVIDMNGYFTAPTDLNGNTAIGAGTLESNTTGTDNTAAGSGALQNNLTGSSNTATGQSALANNTAGGSNTAIGQAALGSNSTGSSNTASGAAALQQNTAGVSNTASGAQALSANIIGSYNTASGAQALQSNTTSSSNTATGYFALNANTFGASNTATGSGVLAANTTGQLNTASGANALQANTVGDMNTANGFAVLESNTTGMQNTAEGAFALPNNTTGTNNIAIGFNSAGEVTTGSNNILIGNQGVSTDGAAAYTGVIRIGSYYQASTYIAGIYGGSPNPLANSLVCVDVSGLLGTSGCTSTPSSRRFKEQITDMGDSSSKLLQLRPVTFLYKPQYDDGSHALQYGLIAEEVAKVYPEMVGYDKDGQPSSVKYQSLAPMLLNELQKQNAQLQLLEARIAALEAFLSSQASAAAIKHRR
jgi:hypothetical protein